MNILIAIWHWFIGYKPLTKTANPRSYIKRSIQLDDHVQHVTSREVGRVIGVEHDIASRDRRLTVELPSGTVQRGLHEKEYVIISSR